jgi:two-component system, OmpR family, response regulator VicR
LKYQFLAIGLQMIKKSAANAGSKLTYMSKKARILYVEDDESLSFVTKDNLEQAGYEITHCSDGRKAVETVKAQRFDLCLLDVMLPEIDGFDVAKAIRKKDEHVPIIFLTAKSMKQDKIHGLTIGADDYITKPFSIEELLLKIEIFLRRTKYLSLLHADESMAIGKYEFDHQNLSLRLNEQTETLTQREADLLKLLLEHKNQVIRRAFILEVLWGKDDYFLGRSLDVFISRLRKSLVDDDTIKIENIHGVGFKFHLAD